MQLSYSYGTSREEGRCNACQGDAQWVTTITLKTAGFRLCDRCAFKLADTLPRFIANASTSKTRQRHESERIPVPLP